MNAFYLSSKAFWNHHQRTGREREREREVGEKNKNAWGSECVGVEVRPVIHAHVCISLLTLY
jgi:hypothetical protein